jgi:membrane fusion protein (multidrug efflux system)
MVLATIARVNQLKVIFNMNEIEMTNLAAGQKVRVYSESRPGVAVEGRIIQLSKSADPKSRTFEMKALIPNTRDRWFKPGMFCKVDVPIARQKETLVIPQTAIQSDGVTSRVFVVRNGRSYQQAVVTGISDNTSTEILQGLSEKDTVITTGTTNVRDSGYVSISIPQK